VRAGRIAVSLVLGLVALLSLLPLYFVLATALKSETAFAESLFAPPWNPVGDNFTEAWRAANIATYMRNSAIVSVAAVTLSTLVATMLAFAIVFLRWPGRSLVYALCLVLLAAPPLLLLIPVFDELVRLELINTRTGVVLLYAALTAPFAVFLLVAYMRSLPWAVLEAAAIDGASVPTLLVRIVVPLSLPAIGTASVFSFLFCWNEFIYSVVLLQSDEVRTLPAGLAALQGKYFTDFPVLMAAVTLSVLPVIALYLCLQRFLVRGIVVGLD
jgi:ABC-type glycerol-3-phosphate transport system permease component